MRRRESTWRNMPQHQSSELTKYDVYRTKWTRGSMPVAPWLSTYMVMSMLMPAKTRSRQNEDEGEEGSIDDDDAGSSIRRRVSVRKQERPFKRKSFNQLIPEAGQAAPTPEAIQTWFRAARELMKSEGLQWIVNVADKIEQDAKTREYYLSNPQQDDDEGKISLEGGKKMVIDDDNVHYVCLVMRKHGAVCHEYSDLKEGANYESDLAWSDWDKLESDIVQFNMQMRTALDKAGCPEIYRQIERDYEDSSHPLSGMLAWKMLKQKQLKVQGAEGAYWALRLNNAVHNGGPMCKHPSQLMFWLQSVDEAATGLMQHRMDENAVTTLTVPMVLNAISEKHGEEWETWRGTAENMLEEYRSNNTAWRVVYRLLEEKFNRKLGTQRVSAITATNNVRAANAGKAGMPQGSVPCLMMVRGV